MNTRYHVASISVTIILLESGCQSLEQVQLTLPIFYDDDNDIIYYFKPTNTVWLQFSVNGWSQIVTGVEFNCIRQPCKAPITSYSFHQHAILWMIGWVDLWEVVGSNPASHCSSSQFCYHYSMDAVLWECCTLVYATWLDKYTVHYL